MSLGPQNHEIVNEDMMRLVRNALLVAGQEMGSRGDHWPVINETIKQITEDWEKLKIERAVHEEMKHYLYENLEEMERLLPTLAPEVQADARPKLKQLRELYDSHFEDADPNALYLEDAELPMYVKRADIILDELELADE